MIRSVLAALALSFVTATVTPAQPAGTFQVVITNLANGRQHPWQRRTWPNETACVEALGNMNAALRSLVGEGDPPETFTGTDAELIRSTQELVMYVTQNTGRVPSFSIACKSAADPA